MKECRSILMIGVAVMLAIAGCEFTYKIKSGEEAYEVKQYALAVNMLGEEYEKSESQQVRAQKAYMTGLAHEKMNNPEQAAEWFEIASRDNYGIEAMVRYAENMRRLERYDDAIAMYTQIMTIAGDPSAHRADVTACRQAEQWKNDSDKSEYSIKPASFNSASTDYAPYVLGPDVVLFTSDREDGANSTYQWTGRNYSDIYIAHLSAGRVESFDNEINSPHNEGTVAMNSDRTTIYFSRCYTEGSADAYCKLMSSSREGESWTVPEIMPFVRDEVNYGHPVISENDSVIVFSSNDAEGAGGYDLFFSQLTKDGWGDPTSFSGYINTPGNEKFPSLHEDTLYFSSDHHVGMGGLDIFKTYINSNGQWTPPINLKAPINSGWDDFGLVVDTFANNRGAVFQQGYFASSRNNSNGTDDVYRFERAKYEPTEEEIAEAEAAVVVDTIDYELYLAFRVMEPVFADPNDPNSERVGKRPLVGARLSVSAGVMGRQFRTNDDGYMVMRAEYDELYAYEAQFRGFLNRRGRFNTSVIEKDSLEPIKTHNIEIVLDPIFKGKEIIMQNIYYDLDKWEIRKDAEPSLDQLAEILTHNPRINIELGSHTDCRADDAYNLDLSQKRAQSAVDYLIGKGISASRMRPKGYGETQFAVSCDCQDCSEEEHQANRRTTFKIVD